jgi:hypothetical protein
VGFDQNAGGQPEEGIVDGEEANDVGAPLDLFV